MSRARPGSAVVSLAALDLRRRPDHRSELRSQLLLGEVVDVLGVAPARPGWWRVRNRADGYPGWVRSWGLVPASRARAARWLKRARVRVAVPSTTARALPGGGAAVSPLHLNARVIAGARRGGRRKVELPDGRRGWVPVRDLARIGDRPPRLEDRVLGLLGVPYLWGGRTALGWDCSGFTQQVLAERGIALPRDAVEQFRACRPIGAADAGREGDLVFFAARGRRVQHVGLALGGAWFADCRGRTRITSLDPRNPMCDKELIAQLRGFGRPVQKPRVGVR